MKRFVGVSLCVMLVSLFVTDVRADDEKETKRQVKVRVATAETEGVGEDKKVEVRAIVIGDPSEDIEKALKDAGIEGDQLKKIQEAIEKARKAGKTTPGKNTRARILQVIPDATVVGPDKKEQRIELKVLRDIPNIMFDGSFSLGEVEESLIEHLDDAKMKQVHEAIEKAMQGLHQHHPKIVALDAIRLDENRFYIGVECAVTVEEREDEAESDETEGVTVRAVFEDSPAEKAGIEEGDVLIQISGKKLESAEALIEAVQVAGKDEKKVAITLVRGDDKKTVRVTPEKRKMFNLTMPKIDLSDLKGGKGEIILKIEEDGGDKPKTMSWQIGPGLITKPKKVEEKDDLEDLKKQVELLSKQVKQLQAELKKTNRPKKAPKKD